MNQIRDPMLIVIGASAGGMTALTKLVAQFPKDLSSGCVLSGHAAIGNSKCWS